MSNTNPTLYENFQRVKEWSIEKFADKEQLAYALADVAFTGDYADLINTPDLNSYVSKAELSECGYLTAVPNDYPTYAAISGMSYITAADVSAMGYITSIPSEYITQDELSANSYLTSVPAGYATEAYVSAAIADLVSTAPATLDTLEEIAQALGDDPNFAATMTSELAKKLEKDDYYADQVAAGVLTYNSATSTYSANVMVSQSALEAMGYITSIPAEYVTDAELSSMGYITSIPSEYITETELSACGYITSIPSEYITETELSTCGYAMALTQAQMDALFPISVGPTFTTVTWSDLFDESLIMEHPDQAWIGPADGTLVQMTGTTVDASSVLGSYVVDNSLISTISGAGATDAANHLSSYIGSYITIFENPYSGMQYTPMWIVTPNYIEPNKLITVQGPLYELGMGEPPMFWWCEIDSTNIVEV